MYAALFVKVLLFACIALASQNDWVRKIAEYDRKRSLSPRSPPSPPLFGRQSTSYLTNKTQKFAVDGDNFPMIPFPIGESYAGEIPVGNGSNTSNTLFFWFFPSTNPLASDEITIWLNGGPGCSSLGGGLLQENGPFLWQPGTALPNLNPYAWTNLTNMVWIDQPLNTGLSQGTPNYTNEYDVAADFNGFWKTFMDTFDLTGRKVYITGESYAGVYIPYIASAMLDANDTRYFNVKGIELINPLIGDYIAQNYVPAVPFSDYFYNVFNLNDTFITQIHELAESCGFTSFFEKALTFPPPVPLPPSVNDTLYENLTGCYIWDDITVAATYVNPCFNFYHILDFCPFQSSQIDFHVLSGGGGNFFNNSDVQAALHVPPKNFGECLAIPFPNGDISPNPAENDVLASVIERINNVLIVSGNLDFLLPSNGTLIAIQNMTWNGKQGFQTRPSDNFFSPYHYGPSGFDIQETDLAPPVYNTAGAGFLGITHTERGLTWCTVDHAGHAVPQYAQGAAYRQLEFLLGRISSLTEMGDFTTQTGNYTGNGDWFKREEEQG